MGNYLLKPGVLLQAFGDASKTCTNANLTDELAQWHLSQCPEKAKYFARIPGTQATPVRVVPPVNIVPPEIRIVPPVIPDITNIVEEKIEPVKKPRKTKK